MRRYARQTTAATLNHGKKSALARDTNDEISQRSLSQMLAAVGQNKDIEAFEALFRHYGPRVRAYMAKLARDGQGAEELMQETMLAVWNKAHQFDPARGNVSSWIFTIARNLRIDAYRKEKRPVFDPTDPAFVPDDVPPADVEFEGRQEADRLRRAMETLPAEQLELLKLSFYNEASHSAIASKLGLPMGTVKSRIRLAFAKLRAALEERA
ncbi:MAG: sigma-70 family RNA polymerase sigma factor [Rhizobium sp.]|jgi:RNA polymerase sigma-70 factor (ECF subfamily)|nr:sigma-70 family RNA polymerase sigma factor [Rhizobium sp.]